MDSGLVPVSLHKDFESIKKVDEFGYEYWEARELMPLFDYIEWRKFNLAIDRARITCVSTNQAVNDHFVGADKMVDIGSKTKRTLRDYHLSRFACYLIAQNCDSRKPAIAFAQTYFAVQTRKQELFENMDDDTKRLYTRQQVTNYNKQLFDTARKAGVEDFGKFNNAGYLGLYGLTADEIKTKKGLGRDDILDRAGSTELAANLFRITQADAKLKLDNTKGEKAASTTHFTVARKVRKTIEEIKNNSRRAGAPPGDVFVR
ncbi:TPA: DNA damage-inducible protein D [Candidatus Uhrbacteria bacterium]|nr:DNA damage-inducible protein D [Candidatus Uhrbacteria bacterium]